MHQSGLVRTTWWALTIAFVLPLTACGGAQGLAGPDHPRTVLAVRDATTGQVRWSQDLDPEASATPPVLTHGLVLQVIPGGDLVARDVRDGSVRWTVPDGQLPAASAPGVLVFEGRGEVAGRRPTGDILWRRQTLGHLVQAAGPTVLVTDPDQLPCPASPCSVPAPGTAPAARAVLSLLDPLTGKGRWAIPVAGRVDSATVAATREVVVVARRRAFDGAQELLGFDAGDGRQLWTRPIADPFRLSSDGTRIAVQLSGDVTTSLVLDPRTGTTLWEAAGSDPRIGEPFLGASYRDQVARAFRRDPATGERLPGEVPFTYGADASGDLLVGADRRLLTAVRGAEPAWTSALPEGVRPLTFVDTDGRVVATVTQVGHAEQGD